MPNLAIITEDNEKTWSAFSGTGPLVFNWAYFQKADLNVTVDGVALSSSAWTVVGVAVDGGYDGGTITLNDAVTLAEVVVYRDTVRLRATQLGAGGASPNAIDTEFNRSITIAQDASAKQYRAISAPHGEAGLTTGTAAQRAGKFMAFDDTGLGILHPSGTETSSLALEQALTTSISNRDDAVAAAIDAAVSAADGLVSAADATSASLTAISARVGAETAEDNAVAAAAMSGTIYSDEAAGRAAVSDGDLYLAVGSTSDKAVDVWQRDDGSNSTLMRSYADLSIVSDIVGAYPETRRVSAAALETTKITEAAGAITPSVYDALAWVSTNEYKIDVVAKAGERKYLNVFCNNGFSGNINCVFDLISGGASGEGADITPLGNGWYRCRIIRTAGTTVSGNLQFRLMNEAGLLSYTGDGSSGLYIDSVSVVDTSAPGVEMLPQTEMTHAAWTKLNCTVSLTGSVANTDGASRLDEVYAASVGLYTADKLVEGSGTINPVVYRALTPAIGIEYVHKVVAKAGERYRLNLKNNGGAVYDATFNLSAGTASGAGAEITHLGEGWYECKVTTTAISGVTGNCQLRVFPDAGGHPYTGDGASGLHVNSASLTRAGVEVWGSAEQFGGTVWTRLNLTVASNNTLFRTLSLGGPSAAPLNPFEGLKWAALGTSITAENKYTNALVELTGMVLENLGASGGSIASGLHYGSLDIYDNIPSIDSDADLVTIEAGINDFGTDNSVLGVLGDTTTATFYGALYAAVVAIRSQAPDALIVFFTPYGGDSRFSTYTMFAANGEGDTLAQFQQAVREVANMVGMPCIDVGSEAGFGYLTNTLWTSDGLHLNDAGGARYATYVKAKLNELNLAGLL